MGSGSSSEAKSTSPPIPIPPEFLSSPPSQSPELRPVPFLAHDLPEFADLTAFTLSNILSPSECAQLLALAEASVADPSSSQDDAPSAPSPWQPALVSIAPGVDVSMGDYRKSERIIWDQQEVADRIWERCASVPGVREAMELKEEVYGKWVFARLNDRLRFLKYSPGDYFKPHVDSPYGYVSGKTEYSTHFTLHLYLNDSVAEVASPVSDNTCEGGATAFLSRDGKRRVDVNPKAGSVLIFQHRGLRHEGSLVTKGVKYTMRSDVLYELVPSSS